MLQDLPPDGGIDTRAAIVSVERVSDRAPHSAFPDLCRHGQSLVLCFREGSQHEGGSSGVVRVLQSEDDGRSWRELALLAEEGIDLRDPRVSVAPDGRLLLVMGGARHAGDAVVELTPRVSFCAASGAAFEAPRRVELRGPAGSGNAWLWRVTWNDGVAWGVVYQGGEQRSAHLVRSADALAWDTVATFEVDGRPSEATLRFLPDGRMVALLRRDAGDRTGRVGVARAPFTEWTWAALPVRIGGPELVVLPDGRLLAAARHHGDETRTRLSWLGLDGSFEPALDLPSGGDTSYPGIVLDADRLRVAYYSSHEERTSIYLATLRLSASAHWRVPCSPVSDAQR